MFHENLGITQEPLSTKKFLFKINSLREPSERQILLNQSIFRETIPGDRHKTSKKTEVEKIVSKAYHSLMTNRKTHPLQGENVNLAELHRQLMERLRDSAPSLITLKRHAAAGLLKPIGTSTAKEAARKLYNVENAITLYEKKTSTPPIDISEIASALSSQVEALLEKRLLQHKPAQHGLDLSEQQLDEIARKVAALLAPQIAKVTEHISGLSGLRNTLMLKYDAVTSLSQQKAERLEQELMALRQEAGLDVRVSKVIQQLSNLTAAVQDIRDDISKLH